MTVLEVRDLHKRYGTVHAVRGISLKVERGSIHAVLGPNGAGKTTTMKCILGLLHPDSGEIRVFGSSDPEEIISKVSYVPEEKRFYEFLTPEKAVRFCERFVENFDASKALSLMDVFKLPRKEKIATFSHGMRTQLYLSLALAQDAELYVFDEPTWGLDPVARNFVLEMMRDLAGDKTVLYASHILPEVEKVADGISIMLDGRFVFQGDLDEARESFKYVVFDSEVEIPEDLAVVSFERGGDFVVVVAGEENLERVLELHPGGARVEPMDLEDIFMALVRGGGHVAE